MSLFFIINFWTNISLNQHITIIIMLVYNYLLSLLVPARRHSGTFFLTTILVPVLFSFFLFYLYQHAGTAAQLIANLAQERWLNVEYLKKKKERKRKEKVIANLAQERWLNVQYLKKEKIKKKKRKSDRQPCAGALTQRSVPILVYIHVCVCVCVCVCVYNELFIYVGSFFFIFSFFRYWTIMSSLYMLVYILY